MAYKSNSFSFYERKISTMSRTGRVSLFLLCLLLANLFVNIGFRLFDATPFDRYTYATDSPSVGGMIYWMTIVVLVGPILETFLFQKLIIHLAKDFLKAKKWLVILLSGLAFGLMHYRSLEYMTRAFAMGCVLAILYSIVVDKSNRQAYWETTLVHAIWNLFSFILAYSIAK